LRERQDPPRRDLDALGRALVVDAPEADGRVLPPVRAEEVDGAARREPGLQAGARLVVDVLPVLGGDRCVPAQQMAHARALRSPMPSDPPLAAAAGEAGSP